jgi:hypothetical protein
LSLTELEKSGNIGGMVFVFLVARKDVGGCE